MAHYIYRTKGLVLGGVEVGEADRYVTLFTEEVGLVRALARGARAARSKLRYHVQPLSWGEFALVRGRDIWRLTGARAYTNLYHEFADDQRKLGVLTRYAALLRRLLGGEEPDQTLFALIETAVAFLQKMEVDDETVENLEYLLVLRTLLALGYLGERRALSDVLKPSPITADVLRRLSPLRRQATREINRALRESQL